MSVRAYILVMTEVGKAADVAKAIGEIDGIDASDDVAGPYDVIAQASAPTTDDLGRMVVSKVQAIDGIVRTTTLLVVNL